MRKEFFEEFQEKTQAQDSKTRLYKLNFTKAMKMGIYM